LGRLADALAKSGLDLRWGTDLRPEAQLTPELCARLRRGGAVACSLGVESASPRILRLIDKGLTSTVVGKAVRNLAQVGIAAELMCFTDFPTETFAEAMATLAFLEEQAPHVAAFIVGQFDLTAGSRVACEPARFGLREIWSVQGDPLGMALFYSERTPSKRDRERDRLEQALDRLATGWLLRSYPWAGSLSTAHTIFYYDHFGSGVFRDLSGQARGRILGTAPAKRTSRPDLTRFAPAEENESKIWHQMIRVRRQVSRQSYDALAAQLPRMHATKRGR
jgi:hypothetical protein